MERKSKEKPEKTEYENLDTNTRVMFLEHATRLIEGGYCLDISVDELAEKLYNAKWRKVSS